MKKEKKEFSKVLAIISIIMFVSTLLFSFIMMWYMMITGVENMLDFAMPISAMTITGGIFGMVMKSYYSKSGLQNCAHIRNSAYREAMNVRLEYIEKVLQLKQKYDVDESEVDEIEAESPFTSMSDSILEGLGSKIDEVNSINEEEPETQNF